MLGIKEIIAEVEQLGSMKSLMSAYEEIASLKMRRIRERVLVNRGFISELADIYQELITSYKEQLQAVLREKKKSKDSISLRSRNGKNGCIYLSSNSGLFNEVLRRTYNEYLAYLEKNPDVEPIIIGEYGKQLFRQQFPDRKFLYFDLANSDATKELKTMINSLAQYENLVIFYPKFSTLSQQTVAMLDVSGQEQLTAKESETRAHYLFEPSLENILTFFEEEIFATIMSQTMTESELAQVASRMVLLDIATENIDTRIKSVELKKRIALHREMNKKQVETLTSMSLWTKRH